MRRSTALSLSLQLSFLAHFSSDRCPGALNLNRPQTLRGRHRKGRCRTREEDQRPSTR